MGAEDAASAESFLKPFLAALASFMCQFQLGAILGQSSTMLPQLQAEDSPIRITKEYASWIASAGVIGTPIASVLAGPLTDKMGRKSVIRMHFLLSAIGHTIVGVSSDGTEILIGRVILSCATGFGVPSLVYIPEICNPRHRSPLLFTATVSSSLGLVYVYTLGGILSWDITSMLTSSLAIIGLVYTFIVPESPAWLFRSHRLNEAIDSIKWLKGQNVNMELELRSLKDACHEQPKERVSLLKQFASPTVIKPFLVLTIISFLQNASGFYILLYYSIDFFLEFKSSYDPRFVSVGLAVTRLVSCTVASVIINRFCRKTMGTFSGLSMGVILLGILGYLHEFGDDAEVLSRYSWVPAAGLTLYVFACSLGVHPLPWLMIFELYPLEVRGRMCGISNGMCYVFTFVFTKLYYTFIANFKIQGTILLFMVASVLFGLFSAFVLPETQGKTLVEIEDRFRPKKKPDKESTLP
nr:PREDICTED: facilitated trehalose transporter Tret1-like [Bemisia tabaci]